MMQQTTIETMSHGVPATPKPWICCSSHGGHPTHQKRKTLCGVLYQALGNLVLDLAFPNELKPKNTNDVDTECPNSGTVRLWKLPSIPQKS